MKRGINFVLLVLFIFGSPIQALANNWQTSQKDFSRNAVVQGVAGSADLSLQWTKTPSRGNFQMPVYQDGILYFSEESGVTDSPKTWNVYAVSKKTGEELWRKSGSGILRCSPAVLGDSIVIPGENLIVLNSKSGAEIWRKKAETNYFFVDPMISENKLFVIERTIYYYGNLESINLTDGTVNWKKMLSLYNYNPPSIFKNNIIMTTGLSSNFSIVTSYKMSDGSPNWTYQHDYNPASSVVVDEQRGIGLLSLAVNNVAAIDLESGSGVIDFGVGSYPTKPVLAGGMVYYLTYQSNNTYFNGCNYVTGGCSIRKKIDAGLIYDRLLVPMLIGEKFYFPTNKGKLYSIGLGDGGGKIFNVANSDVVLEFTMFADGAFILSDYYLKKLYVLGSGAEPITPDNRIELDSPYRTDGEYKPYLGQLHSHYIPDVPTWSKLFNGDPTPAFTENKYKEEGYDFVALTEHNQLIADPGVGDILHITNSEEDTQSQGGNHILAIGVQNQINEALSEQQRIDAVVNQGGVPILAHPNSYRYNWSLKNLLTLHNYRAIELYNKGVDSGGKYLGGIDISGFREKPYALDKWDSLLSNGKIVYGTAGDDYTPGDPGFNGGAVMVLSKTNEQLDILSNLKNGNFYALQGSKAPKINVTTIGNMINVSTDRESAIRFISHGETIQESQNVNVASYSAQGNETYVRVEAESHGKKTWSQPIFVNLRQSAITPFPGGYEVGLSEAILKVKSTNPVHVATLPVSEYPANSPQLGYISQVYSVSSEGTLGDNSELKASYMDKKLLTNENNLSIYKYDQGSTNWEKINSVVDESKKEVAADITDPALYTLSAEGLEDNISPIISLDSSIDLTNFTGEIKVAASDNNAVIKTSFYIDGNMVAEDTNSRDGWSTNVDINSCAIGEHKLVITAEDLSGNVGQNEYVFSITDSSFKMPELTVLAPVNNSELWDASNIAGSFVSNLPVSGISFYLDDYFIGEGEIDGANFSKEISWSQYKEGDHILKIALSDNMGNKAEATKMIYIGQRVVAEILLPNKNSYLQSEKITLSFSSNKDSVVAKLDGNIIANKTENYGFELGLGGHSFTLEYRDNIIARKDFIITTSLTDLSEVVGLLYEKGHIKNFGTYMTIKIKLEVAIRKNKYGKLDIEKTITKFLSLAVTLNYEKYRLDKFAYETIVKSYLFIIENV